jgi:hypothetical protein
MFTIQFENNEQFIINPTSFFTKEAMKQVNKALHFCSRNNYLNLGRITN